MSMSNPQDLESIISS